MLRVEITTTDRMRYDSLGDYFRNGAGTDCIEILDMGSADHEFAVAVHELVESFLCRRRGVTYDQVDAFDFAYTGDGEPGDAPDCPYAKEHLFATKIEAMIVAELGLDWVEYLKFTDKQGERHGGKTRIEQDDHAAA